MNYSFYQTPRKHGAPVNKMRVTFPVALLSEKAHALAIEQMTIASTSDKEGDEENYERHDAWALRNFAHDEDVEAERHLQLAAQYVDYNSKPVSLYETFVLHQQ